jgi:hypothetical protein
VPYTIEDVPQPRSLTTFRKLPIKQGPGTELKKLLSKVGIRPTGTCKCNIHAELMDQEGPDWCEKHIGKIVKWLKEEAKKRRMPLPARLAKIIVRRAIRNSRRESKQPKELPLK